MVQKTNPYESGEQKAIPAVLVYVKSNVQGKPCVLMVSRDARPDDFHAGKWNGLGGKLEAGESPLDAALRETYEECGLELNVSSVKALGSLTFPDFKPHKREDWNVWVFVARCETAQQAWTRGPEGTLAWIPESEVLGLRTWDGDRQFLPHVLSETPFVGTIWYKDGRVARHWISTL